MSFSLSTILETGMKVFKSNSQIIKNEEILQIGMYFSLISKHLAKFFKELNFPSVIQNNVWLTT